MAHPRTPVQQGVSGGLRRSVFFAAGVLGALGCSSRDSSSPAAADSVPAGSLAEAAAPSASASFVNRVWVVAESPQVAVGEMRVFLSDSTLVMTSPHGTPAFGSWRVRDGQLTITEEGRDYPVDVLELTPDVFRIRIRGPGEPVDIHFAPAEQTITAVKPAAQR